MTDEKPFICSALQYYTWLSFLPPLFLDVTSSEGMSGLTPIVASSHCCWHLITTPYHPPCLFLSVTLLHHDFKHSLNFQIALTFFYFLIIISIT